MKKKPKGLRLRIVRNGERSHSAMLLGPGVSGYNFDVWIGFWGNSSSREKEVKRIERWAKREGIPFVWEN